MLEILTSDALTARHGFFTRKGGASSGVFAGLNCGPGSSDQSNIVKINRARVAEAMGLAEAGLVSLAQVHSATVVTLTEPPAARVVADGMVTRVPGIGLGILTADCQPVLFADAKTGVIGAAHAGWRGAKGGVLEATVEAMLALGATKAGIVAVIGPCISQAAYEVGQEFLEAFTADNHDNARFFAAGRGDRMMFGLPAFGLHRLRAAGVGHAEWTRHCTFSDPDRFYSYRRTTQNHEADYGRLISVITL